ncbi:LacI family DNA-binding transcriptional regulator [Bacillus sp. SL00103]
MANIRGDCKSGRIQTTVSRVLNHHPYVKEEKRERVLDAMKELNTREISRLSI